VSTQRPDCIYKLKYVCLLLLAIKTNEGLMLDAAPVACSLLFLSDLSHRDLLPLPVLHHRCLRHLRRAAAVVLSSAWCTVRLVDVGACVVVSLTEASLILSPARIPTACLRFGVKYSLQPLRFSCKPWIPAPGNSCSFLFSASCSLLALCFPRLVYC
jgi:hypothetical protein